MIDIFLKYNCLFVNATLSLDYSFTKHFTNKQLPQMYLQVPYKYRKMNELYIHSGEILSKC